MCMKTAMFLLFFFFSLLTIGKLFPAVSLPFSSPVSKTYLMPKLVGIKSLFEILAEQQN